MPRNPIGIVTVDDILELLLPRAGVGSAFSAAPGEGLCAPGRIAPRERPCRERLRRSPRDHRRGFVTASLPAREGRGAARGWPLLLARPRQARARRLRGSPRRLQVPPARARGLGALRPTREARRLRRL